MTTADQKRKAIVDAGFKICGLGIGTGMESWYALLPGETEFFDNSAEVEANPGTLHRQNYMGFFSCEMDLLNEVFDEIAVEA